MTTIYRITELETAHRGGMNNAVDAQIRGIAKTNDAGNYTIANEIICARIGQTLGLPVPSGVVAEDDSKKLYYLSLDVSFEGKALPPVIPAEFVAEEPRLAAGVAVFDVLVANGDRNANNLARDPAFASPRVSVFDHGHALFGTNAPVGTDRLEAAKDRLGCVADSANLGANSVLLDQPLDAGELEGWVNRVQLLPGYVFEDVCDEIVSIPGINVLREELDKATAWFTDRRARLDQLLWDNKDVFSAVQWSLWRPGQSGGS